MRDPMLSSIITALQLVRFQSIKKKARILIPESTFLIGVVDETGLLEENEVFIQIRKDSFSRKNRSSPTGTRDENSTDEMEHLIDDDRSMA